MRYLTVTFLAVIMLACATKKEEEVAAGNIDKKWWKGTIVYQIYPRSFKDSNGDGVGDLRGIIDKLDYIESLGVNAVWLNPIYSSPNADNGYDVSDYRNIMAEFGTMADFDEMLEGMHKRKIKLIMDIVVNHSSDEHEWFRQSRSSRDNPYRDYYHWWPAEKGKPNYRYSLFDETGDAWKYDKQTNAYYLHYFSAKQPDLNWENPKLRQDVYSFMRFWADKGVDGFRLDAFQFAAKDTTYPKFPEGYEKEFVKYYAMQGNLHEYLREMNREVFSKYDVMTVSEGAGNTMEDAHNLVDEERKELNMAYAFEGVDIAKSTGYDLLHFKKVFTKWDSAFAEKGWLSIFLANHDQARMVSRFASDAPEFREASAKLLNTFILSMRGTPYCYYGDELGMTNPGFKKIEQYRDIQALNMYKKTVSSGGDLDEYLKELRFSSRDNGRTPMQWESTLNAGFSSATPWLSVNANYNEINVASQEDDPHSVLNHFRKLTELRKKTDELVYGKYTLLLKDHPQVYAYTRVLNDTRLLVLLNFSKDEIEVRVDELSSIKDTLINNYDNLQIDGSKMTLNPYQAVILSY